MAKNDPRQIENNRSKSIEWWNKLEGSKRVELASDYIGRVPASLIGREIETVWNCVHIKSIL
jgi:hypothetical protein